MPKHSKVKHTYAFYKNRRNDPKWREAYLEARNKHLIKNFIMVIVLIILAIFAYFTFYSAGSQQSDSTTTNSASSNSTTSSTSSSSSSTSSATSSSSSNSNVDNSSDASEYQTTSTVGQYTVSTEELNAIPTFLRTYKNSNGETKYSTTSVSLDDTSGDGTVTISNNDLTAHYAEIVTKKIKVKNSAGNIRVVKVNTAIVLDNSNTVIYAFKNSTGGISLASSTGSNILVESLSQS